MTVYRISNYAALDGKGALRALNNRWNNPGTPMVYCSESVALAKGEISRRIPLHMLPPGFLILTITFPDELLTALYPIPAGWDQVPPGQLTKTIGDEFVKAGKYLALRVPSAFDKNAFNVLLNPLHPLFHQVVMVGQEPLYI